MTLQGKWIFCFFPSKKNTGSIFFLSLLLPASWFIKGPTDPNSLGVSGFSYWSETQLLISPRNRLVNTAEYNCGRNSDKQAVAAGISWACSPVMLLLYWGHIWMKLQQWLSGAVWLSWSSRNAEVLWNHKVIWENYHPLHRFLSSVLTTLSSGIFPHVKNTCSV